MNGNNNRVLNEDELREWDSLLTSSPQSTVFHKSIWLTTCGKLSNKKVLIMGEFEDDSLIGGCPLFIKNFPAFKVAYGSEKMTPYGGFILRHSESTKVREREKTSFSAFASMSDGISNIKFDHITIINSPALQDIRPFIERGWNPILYYTYILSLKGDIERDISKNVRRTMRKAQKENITIKKYYDKNIYWDLNMETYKRQGTIPPFSKEYLHGLLEMIMQNNLGEMWIAETDTGEPASAEVLVWDENMAYRWSAASDTKFLDTGAVSLLMFSVFLDLKERNFGMINLLGGNVPKISKFISSFNPSLVPYFGIMNSSPRYRLVSQLLNMKRLILK
jgi:hypothetical protein